MGNSEIRHRVWTAITANDPDTLRNVLKKYPMFLNEPISGDQKTNAVTRAAYLDRPHIIAELVIMGADINKTGKSGITALMWAAAKNNIESLKILLNYNANVEQKGPFQLMAIDFAVLYGAYTTGHYMYSLGIKPSKNLQQYIEIKRKMGTPAVDHSEFLIALDTNVLPTNAPIFASVIREIIVDDSDRDPSDTWGSRISDFESPKNFTRSAQNLQTVFQKNGPSAPHINQNDRNRAADSDLEEIFL